MNVLFICRYNKFRSKLAEAFFKKYTNKHSAKSAGIIKGSAVDDKIKACGSRNGVKLGGVSQSITVPLLRWYDIMVIVADDVPRSLFADNWEKYGKKLEHWKIPDTEDDNVKEQDRIAKLIEKRIKKLISQISK
jgi:protein-tyrosine-phosphatase